ncbi:hypothetical protein ABQW72_14970 [Xanthomonas hortorum pv. pelargonii]|uniref:hypothetical protein n=2 Tax=Xanthomonas TaxID=338 RepID=UPI002043FEDD|nr:hypothetical protein [Xanthomonas hortorum]MCM5593436.1 hypothetical protein [Xanthomonas hortorum pv. pelargonii]MDC8717514.1 hypothetical protein [Xanthomonas hortorum pv. pelargonii]MDC8738620.1 hypothetical protein [Xanthomonas hortorum pv. pelargonii]
MDPPGPHHANHDELAAGDPADESGQYIATVTYPQYACRACEQVAAEPVAAAIIERG